MVFLKNNLAQASLEYLMTYGWALVLLVAVVSVLFVLTGTPVGYACSGLGKMLCKTVSADGSDLFVVLQNGSGQDISIDPFTGIEFDGRSGFGVVVYQGKEYRFENVRIKAGDSFIVKGPSVNSASQLKLTYKETNTGFVKTQEIGLETPKKEICNNLVADTPANLIDCTNPECKTCEYIFIRPNGATGDSVQINGMANPQIFSVENLTGLLPGSAWKVNQMEIFIYANDEPAGASLQAVDSTGSTDGRHIVGSIPAIKKGWNIVSLAPEQDYYMQRELPFTEVVLSSLTTSFSMSTKIGQEPRLIIQVQKP